MSKASKVIILTGASRGIGLAIAHYLLKAHHNVVVVARSREPLNALKEQYKDRVQVLAGDASDSSLGEQALILAKATWNRLDAVILNHGVLDPVTRIAQADVDAWRHAFDINYFSFVSMIKACLPDLKQSKGRIIMVSSGAALNGYSTWGAYGSAKAAVNHLAMTLKVEEPDVTTIALRPGVVDTQMQGDIRTKHSTLMDQHNADHFHKLHASGELLKPEQPGHVIAELALRAPADLNGVFISWNDEKLKDFQSE